MKKTAPSEAEIYALPSVIESERAILANLLADESGLVEIEANLSPSDFYLDSHRAIYEAMLALRENSTRIDPITLQNQLRRAGKLEYVGGGAFIGQVVDGGYMRADFRTHCAEVIRASIDRALAKGCHHARNMIIDLESAVDVLTYLDKLVLEQRARLSQQRQSKTLAQAVGLAIDELRDIQNGKMTARYQTGFLAIDKALGGGIGSKYVLIGARTSKGKSTIALQFALQGASLQPDDVGAIFSLEMNARELGHRVLNIATGIEDKYYKAARFTQDERAAIVETQEQLFSRLIEVYDNPQLTPAMFLAAGLNTKRLHGRLDYTIVDYLALMEQDGRQSDRRFEKVVEISRQMKVAQMVLDCPVITPVQLKPQADTTERDLQLTDVAEADALVRDADIVLLLQAGQDEGAFTRYKIDAAKVRGGRLFTTYLNFNKLCGRFENAAESTAPAKMAYEEE